MKEKIALLNKLLLRVRCRMFSDPVEGISVYSASTSGWVLGDHRDTKITGDVYVLSHKSGRKVAYITSIKSRDPGDMTTLTNTNAVRVSFETEQELQAFCKENGLVLSSIVLAPQRN